MTPNDNDYNAKYYQENKNKIAKKRKSKYNEDKEYQKKCKDRARKYYQKHKGKYRKQIERPTNEHKKIFDTHRGTQTFYGITYFAYVIDRTPATINSWTNKGILPDHCIVDDRRKRWFSVDFMNMVKKVIKEYKQGRVSDMKNFADTMHRAYEAWKNKGGDGL